MVFFYLSSDDISVIEKHAQVPVSECTYVPYRYILYVPAAGVLDYQESNYRTSTADEKDDKNKYMANSMMYTKALHVIYYWVRGFQHNPAVALTKAECFGDE